MSKKTAPRIPPVIRPDNKATDFHTVTSALACMQKTLGFTVSRPTLVRLMDEKGCLKRIGSQYLIHKAGFQKYLLEIKK